MQIFKSFCSILFLNYVISVSVFSQKIDSIQINTGQKLFEANCITCHNFKMDGIGPNLAGLKGKLSSEWLNSFIRNPKAKIDGKDARALSQLKKFKAIMPSFEQLNSAEISSIVDYIQSQELGKATTPKNGPKEIADPIPQKVPMSDIIVNLTEIAPIPYSSDTKLHTRIVKLDYEPSSKQDYVLDLNGKLYQLKGNTPFEYLDIAKYFPNFKNKPGHATGFGSFAFHPDFAKNGLLYTSHSENAGSQKADFAYADSIKVALQWVVNEWKTATPNSIPFNGKPRELFRINMTSQIHGMQQISFNPISKPSDADYGLLYIGIGDGGCVESGFSGILNQKESLWGKLIRIDPTGNNSKNRQYGIPNFNPFIKIAGMGEIFALGFRNPHRFTWTKTGKLLVSNIGQRQIESVYMVGKGDNCGWPLREGTFMLGKNENINKVYPLPKNDPFYNYTYPVLQIDHDEIIAISGGLEYNGDAVPQLKGKYIFGGVAEGRLFYAEMKEIVKGKQAKIHEFKASLNGKTLTFPNITGNDRADLRFGKNAIGELYIFTKGDGKIYSVSK